MIRRLFWLLAGAVLGVTGYRRAGRFARSLRPASAVRPAGRVLRAVTWPGHPATGRAGGAARDHVAPFLADVRDGMEMYLDHHAAQPGDGGRFRYDNAKDGR
jgi:hypothetical protein